MARFSQNRCRGIIRSYFLYGDWLPAGTSRNAWRSVTIGDMGLDDPPLLNEPHLRKEGIALDLRAEFAIRGGNIPSPLAQLKKKSLTLGELGDWCFANQKG